MSVTQLTSKFQGLGDRLINWLIKAANPEDATENPENDAERD